VVGIKASIPENKIAFRWTFIVLPLVFLFISLVLTAVFYHMLPAQLAYHFQDDLPDKWLSRGALLAWMLLPQLCFTFLAFIVVRMVLLSARYWPVDSGPLSRMLPVMGNMVVLPQIILTFTMLDIFLYNAYQIRLIPVWIIAVIIMVLGVAILGYIFIKLIQQARHLSANARQE
jgi:uncharacterized membrane protein